MLPRSSPALLRASTRLSQLQTQTVPSSASSSISSSRPGARTMASQATSFKLNTGAEIPAIGFGTWQDKDSQEDAVLAALQAGYRHIDGARIYGTEPMVARAIKRSGVPRSSIFITTKLWNNSHFPDDVEKACDASLKDLETDYLDLYLMHWPSPFARSDKLMPKDFNEKIIPGDTDYIDTWKALEKLQKNGKCRAIGVSNFSKGEMERLMKVAEIKPAVHQIELHPLLQQRPFVEFHRENDIHITQYSPFGNSNPIYSTGKGISRMIEDPILVEIGKKHGKTGSQVALAWGIAQGHSVIPKSKTPSRIKDNLEGDFKLDEDDMQKIGGMDKKLRFNNPSASFGWNFYRDLEGI